MLFGLTFIQYLLKNVFSIIFAFINRKCSTFHSLEKLLITLGGCCKPWACGHICKTQQNSSPKTGPPLCPSHLGHSVGKGCSDSHCFSICHCFSVCHQLVKLSLIVSFSNNFKVVTFLILANNHLHSCLLLYQDFS